MGVALFFGLVFFLSMRSYDKQEKEREEREKKWQKEREEREKKWQKEREESKEAQSGKKPDENEQ